MKISMGFAFAAMVALAIPACTGSGVPDDLESEGGGDDSAESESVGEVSEPLMSCPNGRPYLDVGPMYSYMSGGTSYKFSVFRKYGVAQVAYRRERSDGVLVERGTMARWSQCPHSNEPVQVITSAGISSSCTHLCFANGMEELNCPTYQLELSKTHELEVCVSKSGADENQPGIPDCGVGRDINLGCITQQQCRDACKKRGGGDNGKENTCLKEWDCDNEDGLSTVGMYLDDGSCSDFDFLCPPTDGEPTGGGADLYSMCYAMGYVGGCPLVF